jgi:reactive intermediate/imine deaminase
VTKRPISTEDSAPPAGPYSQAVEANGFLFISGQGPTTATGEEVRGSFDEEAKQTFDNLEAIASAAGTSLAHAVRVGVYLRDMGNITRVNELYAERFESPLPARTTIQVDLPGFQIEVDAILLVDS